MAKFVASDAMPRKKEGFRCRQASERDSLLSSTWLFNFHTIHSQFLPKKKIKLTAQKVTKTNSKQGSRSKTWKFSELEN